MAAEDIRRSDARVRAGVPAAILVALAIVVYGGYDRHWSWIGINGRTATLWDWLHLLLLPLLVPTVVVPSLRSLAMARVELLEEEEEDRPSRPSWWPPRSPPRRPPRTLPVVSPMCRATVAA